MKAILIDVVKREVKVIDIDPVKVLTDLYTLIGCELVEAVSIDERNDLYVDEEGLLTLGSESKFFQFGDSDPLVGNGVILGVNPETGSSAPCTVDVEDVKEMVKFWSIQEVESGVYRM